MLKPPHKVTRRIATGAGMPPAIRKPSNPQSPGGLGLPLNSPEKYIHTHACVWRTSDLAKVGGPLSVVTVCTSMLCVKIRLIEGDPFQL